MTAALARIYVERMLRISRSPGAALDTTDRGALRWACLLAERELTALEAAERATRAEDDTQRLGPR